MLNQVGRVEEKRGSVQDRRCQMRAASFVAALAEWSIAPFPLPRSSNRACRFPAPGSRTSFTRRHAPVRARRIRGNERPASQTHRGWETGARIRVAGIETALTHLVNALDAMSRVEQDRVHLLR